MPQPNGRICNERLGGQSGLSDKFEIASAATSTEEIGNPVYPPARRKLAEHGISCEGKTARQMTRRDYETYNYLIAMDHNNLRNMARFVGDDPEHKVSLLMDHTRRPGDVADHGIPGTLSYLAGCAGRLHGSAGRTALTGEFYDRALL